MKLKKFKVFQRTYKRIRLKRLLRRLLLLKSKTRAKRANKHLRSKRIMRGSALTLIIYPGSSKICLHRCSSFSRPHKIHVIGAQMTFVKMVAYSK